MSIVLPGQDKKIYTTFGRFQPPTVGHGENFDAIAKAAKAGGGDYRIYLSQKNTPTKDNPLPPDYKLEIIKKAFPEHAKNIYGGSKFNVIGACLAHCMLDGYRHLIYMCGSDRMPEMGWVINFNGKKSKDGSNYYQFLTARLESSGSRDAEKDTYTMSGTKMRRAAQNDDWDFFRMGAPKGLNDAQARLLMGKLKATLKGIKV